MTVLETDPEEERRATEAKAKAETEQREKAEKERQLKVGMGQLCEAAVLPGPQQDSYFSHTFTV